MIADRQKNRRRKWRAPSRRENPAARITRRRLKKGWKRLEWA
ncbi:hypothetical protein SAMN05660479_00927 [Microbulbifer thermotolerans]|nr:hypothetical protein SAMN05660479_00927 [Microbulbifer thermotolerans]